MGIKTYKVGKIKIDGNDLGECDSATLNITLDIGETTEIGDTWKENMALGKSWNLSVSVKHNPDDAAQAAMRGEYMSGDGHVAAVYMYEDNTHYFHGAAIITSFNITKGVNAIDVLTMTFECNGVLNYT